MERKIGEIIQEVMKRKGKSASWLAREIPCERTNVYDIFRRKDINIRLLERLSVILEHDFFEEISKGVAAQIKCNKA